jgi:hypothetical protein
VETDAVDLRARAAVRRRAARPPQLVVACAWFARCKTPVAVAADDGGDDVAVVDDGGDQAPTAAGSLPLGTPRRHSAMPLRLRVPTILNTYNTANCEPSSPMRTMASAPSLVNGIEDEHSGRAASADRAATDLFPPPGPVAVRVAYLVSPASSTARAGRAAVPRTAAATAPPFREWGFTPV